MLTVLNQVLRTLLHSRLQLGIQQYQDDPSFQGDIILLEPGETDLVTRDRPCAPALRATG